MTRRHRTLPLLVVAGLAVAVVWRAPSASAACHHFSVAASPNPVNEGQTVTVTVSRDGTVGPSNVDVSTVDDTAKAGDDYTALKKTVSFTTDQSQAFPVPIATHTTPQPERAFKLHLSNPGGCSVNTNYVLDPDVRVTIQANGVAESSSTTAATAAPTTTATSTSTSAPATSAATTTTATTTSTTAPPRSTSSITIPFVSSVPAPTQAAAASTGASTGTAGDDNDIPAGAAVAGVLALIAAAGATLGYALLQVRKP